MKTEYQNLKNAIIETKTTFRMIAKDSKNWSSMNWAAMLSPENYALLRAFNKFLFGSEYKIHATALAIDLYDFETFISLKSNA
jgi:hypothetical protein